VAGGDHLAVDEYFGRDHARIVALDGYLVKRIRITGPVDEVAFGRKQGPLFDRIIAVANVAERCIEPFHRDIGQKSEPPGIDADHRNRPQIEHPDRFEESAVPPVADQDTYLVVNLAGTAVKLFGSEKPSGKFRHLSGKFAVDLKGKAMPGKRTEQSVKFTGPVRSLGTAVEGNFHTAAD